jgi:hypothetical protein
MPAITPTGTLMPKNHRQPQVETSSPPTVGPRASPMACAAARMPRAVVNTMNPYRHSSVRPRASESLPTGIRIAARVSS